MTRRWWVVPLACGLAACGGGGGGGANADPIAVSFGPSTVHRCAARGPSTANVTVVAGAWLSRPAHDVARVNVLVTGTAVDPSTVAVTADGGRAYDVSAHLVSDLPVGTYEGTISLELCRDAACTSRHPLAGATLPYVVEVFPDPSLVVSTGGAIGTGSGPLHDIYQVAPGATVRVDSDRPVTWMTGSVSGPPTLEATATTSTTWTAALSGAPGAWIQVLARTTCGGAPAGAAGVLLLLQ